MKSDKANVWTSILVASTVGWFFFGVLPIQSYLSCQSQFPFSLGDLLQEYAVTGVIVTAALATILHFLSRGFGLWAHVLLLSGVVCCILESGPLSIDLPEFNGVFDGYKLVWRMVAD